MPPDVCPRPRRRRRRYQIATEFVLISRSDLSSPRPAPRARTAPGAPSSRSRARTSCAPPLLSRPRTRRSRCPLSTCYTRRTARDSSSEREACR
eukprot:8930-Pelagococcus_subviridis.AAC.5